uniref:Islet amyloid polypeptide n=1 Tax=Phocoena sinus TaxID=42100 RepID=A0A8C9E1S7_PHOSS
VCYMISKLHLQVSKSSVSNLSYLFDVTSHQMEKRKCYTATCATQRLENFLVWSSNNLGVIFSPTKVGSNTYSKRNTVDILKREPLNYLLPLEPLKMNYFGCTFLFLKHF